MNLKNKFLLIFLLPLLAFSVHKYYLSLTQIEYVKEQKSVQIIIRVFMDDIELAINKENNIDAKLTTSQEVKDVDAYFKTYIKKNFNIKVNNKQYSYEYIGKEYEGDIVYFYLEVTNISELNDLEIHNSILTDYFSDQQNLIKVKANGKNRSKMLTKKNDKGLLKF